MTVVLEPSGQANVAYEQRDKTGHASTEWVMGRYFTPDTDCVER